MASLTAYSSTGDGFAGRNGADAAWADARSGAGIDSRNNLVADVTIDNTFAGGVYYCNRGFYFFDTSALGASATISAAVFSLLRNDASYAFSNVDSASCHVVSSTSADPTVAGSKNLIGTINFGSVTFASTTDGAYFDITLNADGRAGISKTGVTKFATIGDRDLNNSAPTGNGNKLSVIQADTAGTGSDPKLVVTYSTSSIKTWNGLADASVKNYNGLARASAKTWNGLA